MKNGLAILATAAVLLAGAHLVNRQAETTTPPPPQRTHAPMVLGSSDQADSPKAPAPPLPAREHEHEQIQRSATPPQAARDTAQRFMNAYLKWERGLRDSRTVAVMRQATSPGLWRELHSGASKPGRNPRVPVQRLRRVLAGSAGSRRATTVLAELERRHQLATLAVVVHRRQGRWMVTSLSP